MVPTPAECEDFFGEACAELEATVRAPTGDEAEGDAGGEGEGGAARLELPDNFEPRLDFEEFLTWLWLCMRARFGADEPRLGFKVGSFLEADPQVSPPRREMEVEVVKEKKKKGAS